MRLQLSFYEDIFFKLSETLITPKWNILIFLSDTWVIDTCHFTNTALPYKCEKNLWRVELSKIFHGTVRRKKNLPRTLRCSIIRWGSFWKLQQSITTKGAWIFISSKYFNPGLFQQRATVKVKLNRLLKDVKGKTVAIKTRSWIWNNNQSLLLSSLNMKIAIRACARTRSSRKTFFLIN